MEPQELEQAIKSDLETIATMKMGFVSAKDFYGNRFKLALKISLLLLGINLSLMLFLIGVGLYKIQITLELVLVTWALAFVAGFFLSFSFSRFRLISQLIKGRLKTEQLLRETLRYMGFMCLGIYCVAYKLFTLVVTMGMDSHIQEALYFIGVFSQMSALVFSTGATGLLFGVELDRIGLGTLFNILSETISNKMRGQLATSLSKDS